jgi:hypothetical protein
MLRLVLHITMRRMDFYAGEHHETASKFIGQRALAAIYSAAKQATVQWTERRKTIE